MLERIFRSEACSEDIHRVAGTITILDGEIRRSNSATCEEA